MSKEKVVLAYSGGLDTSVCVKWLQDEKNLDVVCVCGNVGQEETGLDAKKQKALDLGVLDCQVLDLRDEFSDEFLTKAIAANSMYENKYPLLSALSRPLLAKKLGFDPAVMASPIITTIVDFLSLLVYFAFATAILGIG